MKFRVKNTTLKHNDGVYPEGSLIELSPEDARGLERVLERVEETPQGAQETLKEVSQSEQKEEKPKRGGKR